MTAATVKTRDKVNDEFFFFFFILSTEAYTTEAIQEYYCATDCDARIVLLFIMFLSFA